MLRVNINDANKTQRKRTLQPATDTSVITMLCKAAGDPLRMQILKVLQQNAYGVLELCAIFDIRQSAMSHHLKILSSASLVATRREGTSIFYRRNELHPDPELQNLLDSLFQTIDLAALDFSYTIDLHQSMQSDRRLRSLFLTRTRAALNKIKT